MLSFKKPFSHILKITLIIKKIATNPVALKHSSRVAPDPAFPAHPPAAYVPARAASLAARTICAAPRARARAARATAAPALTDVEAALYASGTNPALQHALPAV